MSNPTDDLITQQLTQDLLKERRSDRIWKTIRSMAWLLLFAYIVVNIIHALKSETPTPLSHKKYAAFIRLDGMIAPGRDFSAEQVVPALHDAFADKKAEGVIIDINSPGGTPVQASIIHDAILAYKKQYHKKVIVVGEDLLTSGAYFIAVAADKIYVNPNTLTGSIGVVMKGFGFVDLMKKAGVERRVYVAGNNKDRLDPFLPQTPEDLAKINEVMSEVHQNFIDAVIEGRKGKLHADASTLFNGDFWSGQSALKLGLVDGIGNLLDVSQAEFKTTDFYDYSTGSTFFKKLGGQFSSAFDSMIYTYS